MRNILILCALLGFCSFAFADEPVLTEQESQFLQILNDARTAKGLPLFSGIENSVSSSVFSSGKRGTIRLSLPSWCSVFGLRTKNRFFFQSTSFHFNAITSLGHRNPPILARAIITRQS